MTKDTLLRVLTALTRRNDVVLSALLVSVIFMMVIPLPPAMLDVLLAISISGGVLLLMLAVYLQSPLDFSAFPSVLLIITIYRLALSISTTRQILLQADAGQIIFTFGNFVVAGNLIVGLVIFLIITIVQFLVITKGSERVAEVSARFSLDAMPGKQMSIDGDMRAGVIDMEEARRRRDLVQKESQMFGAMDGAMKFVKGDAIAGLIVTAVNILGGIAIGTMQRGMTTGEAVELYSILTIGDGLVQQIPALLTSITAGIIVTRVTSEEAGNLGEDIGRQMFSEPRALMIGAAMMLVFALIPGMPMPVFLGLAVITGGAGYAMHRNALRDHQTAQAGLQALTRLPAARKAGTPPAPIRSGQRHAGGGQREQDVEDFVHTVPVMIDLAAHLQEHLDAPALNDELIRVRRALYFDLGVPFPGIHLRFNEQMPTETYAILLHEIPMSQGTLPVGRLFVREDPENLGMFGVKFETGPKFLPGLPTVWVGAETGPLLERAGVTTMDAPKILTFHLSVLLRKYAQDFLGIQETRYLLEKMEQSYPELVKETQRVVPLQKIAEVFQRLVSEDVSIRNLRQVLQSLIEWGQKEKDTVLLTEYIRGTLSRQISYRFSSGRNLLPAYLFSPDAEDAVRNAIRQTSAGSYLALDPAKARRLIDNVRKAVGDRSGRTQTPVFIASMDVRRYLRKLIESEFHELPVLSYQELTKEITIQPLARIDL